MATHTAPEVWDVQGRRIDLPVRIHQATFAGAVWRPPRSAVDAVLEPYGLKGAGFGGTGIAFLMCVQYAEFVLGSYDEAGVGVLADGPGVPGLFVLDLPVTGAFTREAGREIWGLPKWLMTSTADLGGSHSTMKVSDGDVPVMDATIRAPRRALPVPAPMVMPTWARAEDGPNAGRLLRGKASLCGHGYRIGRGRGSSITWGDHPMADRARVLGMDRPPFVTISAERMSGFIGESRVVDG